MSGDVVSLEIAGKRFSNWTQYAFNSHFLMPTDGWSFQVGGDAITDQFLDSVKPGTVVTLRIGDLVQCSGYVDAIEPHTDRNGGSSVTIHGRDKLSPVIDAQINPTITFPDNQTLEDFLKTALGPYGFTNFEVDNERNVTVSAGHAIKRRRKPKKLREYKINYNKPQHNESIFTIVSRVTQRLGLWIWASADGNTIVVSKPDFDQPTRYRLINRRSDPSRNNVLSGGIMLDSTDQPSFIVAHGNVPGKTFETTTIKSGILGFIPASQEDLSSREDSFNPSVVALINIETETHVIQPPPPPKIVDRFASMVARPKYLRDDMSHTQEELEHFAQREMSLLQRKAVVGKFEVEGHTQNGQPWQVDTMVDVTDELSRWNGPMWILSRSFRQSRGGGTTTALECIPPFMLVF